MADILGIDIGSRFVKVIEIRQKPRLQLVNAILFETPYASFEQIEPAQRQIDTKSFWAEITKYIPLPMINRCIIGVDMPAVSISTTTVLLPKMGKGELAQAAVAEAKRKLIPASGSQHIFEYSILEEKLFAKIPKIEALVIRSEKACVGNTLALFKDINTIPSFITPAYSTLPNLIPKEIWSHNEDVLFVDIGASSLNISICKEGRLIVTRDITYGLNDIVQDFSRKLNLSENEAENAIREYGIPQTTFDITNKVLIAEEIMRQKYEVVNAATEEKVKANLLEMGMLWQAHIDRIVNELRRSFIYYKEQSGGRRIGYIYFLGGGSQIKNLVNILSASIGGQCKIMLPFEGIEIIKKRYRDAASSTPVFTNALSLAVSISLDEYKRKLINFLPIELKKRGSAAVRRLVLFIMGIGLFIGFSLALVNMLIGGHLLKASIKEAEFGLKRVKKIADKLKSLSDQETETERISSQIEKIIKQRQDFSYPLKELSRIIPREILLTHLSISKSDGQMGEDISQAGSAGAVSGGKYRLKIEAEIFADYEKTIKIIDQFCGKLEAVHHFSNITSAPLKLEEISPREKGTLEGSPLTEERLRDFTLTAEVAAK